MNTRLQDPLGGIWAVLAGLVYAARAPKRHPWRKAKKGALFLMCRCSYDHRLGPRRGGVVRVRLQRVSMTELTKSLCYSKSLSFTRETFLMDRVAGLEGHQHGRLCH